MRPKGRRQPRQFKTFTCQQQDNKSFKIALPPNLCHPPDEKGTANTRYYYVSWYASSLSSVSLSSHEYLVQFESFLMPFKVTVKVLHLLLLSNAELQKVWNCLSFFLYNFCYCTEMLKNGDRSPMGLWVFLHGQQNLEALLFARSNPL